MPAATPSWPTLRWISPKTSSARLSWPTRSSNSRILHIAWRRARASGCDGLDLRRGTLVGPSVHLVEWQGAQVLGQHLDTPGLGVAHVQRDLHVAADVELALTGQLAPVDDLVELVVHVLVLAVPQLDPAEALERELAQILGLDAELPHVPRVDHHAGVVDPVHHVERL